MANFDQVGKQFVSQYYPLFGTNRKAIIGVYKDNSLVTYMGKQMQGTQSIMNFFETGITFTKADYKPEDIDCQPILSSPNSILVTVNGLVQVDNEQRSLKFNDVFILSTDNSGSNYFVANQTFRILGGGSQ